MFPFLINKLIRSSFYWELAAILTFILSPDYAVPISSHNLHHSQAIDMMEAVI